MRAAATGLCALSLLAACAAPAPLAPTPTPNGVVAVQGATATPVVVRAVEPAQPAVPPGLVAVPTLRPSALVSPVPLPLAIVAGRSAADVRVTLDALLQEQAYLVAAAMSASANARLDELIGATSALDQNSLAIAQVIGAVKGQASAQALIDPWRAEASDLIQLPRAPDSRELDAHDDAIAEQLALADLSGQTLNGLLGQRMSAFRELAAAVARQDVADTVARAQVVATMSDDLAQPLARAISIVVPGQAPAPSEGGDVNLRLALARTLLARVYLVGGGLAAAAEGRSADLQAAQSAVDANASEVEQQLSAVWNADVAHGAALGLRAQNAALLSVAAGGDSRSLAAAGDSRSAAAGGDSRSAAAGGDRRAAAATIDRARAELDGALSSANQLLPPGLLAQQFRASDQPLLTAADAFAARDFSSAFTRLRESAKQSTKPASTLALSMVDRYPARYLLLPTPAPGP